MRVKQRGVTLIELLTVMVVLAILAAVAVPSYRRYLVRAQRTDASTALLRLQTAQEKFFLQNGRFTDNLANAPNGTPPGLGIGVVSEHGFYDLGVDLDDPSGYLAIATPVAGGGQNDDTSCVELSVNAVGVKKAKDSGGADRTTECWR